MRPLALAYTAQTFFVANEPAAIDRENTLRKTPRAFMSGEGPDLLVTTLAGSGTPGQADGAGSVATFNSPFALSLHGNVLLIADLQNHRIRSMSLEWPHNVSTIAGSGQPALEDGVGLSASFNRPAAMENDGQVLFVADRYNHAIRSVHLDSAEVSTIAGSGTSGSEDGIGAGAQLHGPTGLALSGTRLFVADQLNSAIRVIDIATRRVSTLAVPQGTFDRPTGLSVRCVLADQPGCAASAPRQLIVADQQHDRVALLGLDDGHVVTLAGSTKPGATDGRGSRASFHAPTGLALRAYSVVVADRNNGLLRSIDLASGQTSTLAGNSRIAELVDGVGGAAAFRGPTGLALSPDGRSLWVADHYNHAIRHVALPEDLPASKQPADVSAASKSLSRPARPPASPAQLRMSPPARATSAPPPPSPLPREQPPLPLAGHTPVPTPLPRDETPRTDGHLALFLALVALALALCGPKLLRRLTTRQGAERDGHHRPGSRLCGSDAPHDSGERSDASVATLDLADDLDGETLVGVLMDPRVEMVDMEREG